jgi:hypothetical protein
VKQDPLSEAGLLKAFKSKNTIRDQGVYTIDVRELPGPMGLLQGLPEQFFAVGPKSFLDYTSAAVLNSRKKLLVKPEQHWFQKTRQLVDWAVAEGFAIISSYGNIAYSLTSYTAKGHPVVVVCDDVLPFMLPAYKLDCFLQKYRGIFQWDNTLFLSPFPPGSVMPKRARWTLRDRLVASLATVLLPAEVRPGGNMAKILEDRWSSVKICDVFPREHENNQCSSLRSSHMSAAAFMKEGSSIKKTSFGNAQFLFHYTRSCYGPWPGQTLQTYLDSLLERHNGAAHTAFDTLAHIVEEGLIRGSSLLSRKKIPVVSFTERSPWELEGLIKWRRGLRRWSVEPYGLGIKLDTLISLGVKPVIYGTEAIYRSLPDDKKYLFHPDNGVGKDWNKEKEWRVAGDVPLGQIPQDAVVIFVAGDQEVFTMRQIVRYRVEKI